MPCVQVFTKNAASVYFFVLPIEIYAKMCYNNKQADTQCVEAAIKPIRQIGALTMKMKYFLRIVFLLVIICSALVSVRYAVEMYRSKYATRYLKGNAC